MKKNKLLTVTALCMSTFFILTGCSNKDGADASSSSQTVESSSTPVSESSQESSASTEPSTQPEAGADKNASDLTGLIGKTDADVVALLGEGTSTTEADGKVTVREYDHTVYGKENTSTVAYDENGNANMIIVYATQNEFDVWDQHLTAELGETADASDNNDEGSKTKEKSWKLDGNVMVSLKDAYDTLSLEIFVGE